MLSQTILRNGLAILLIFLVYQLGYSIERTDFHVLISHYACFFIAYLAIFKYFKTAKDLSFFIGLAILLRLILVFSLPNFSDDIYRFIWDGRLINQGINPFDHLPSYYIEHNIIIKGIDTALYQQLNSPHYFTIYPPINQLIFALATYLNPTSIYGSNLFIKGCLFCFEVGSIYLIIQLLRHFSLPSKNVLLYALNPLIIIELIGNLHFEGAMIFFLLLAIWLMAVKQKWLLSALALGLSITAKLLPLMFLPLWIRRLGKKDFSVESERKNTTIYFWQKAWWHLNYKKILSYFSILGTLLFFLFLPLINGVFISNFGKSLNLYFQKFEFNASIYYLFRWIGFQYKGYNIIGTLGPTLALVAFISILLIALFEQKITWKNLFHAILFSITCYLFCATTIHPWYVALPVVFCLFTSFRFPILWSGLIFFTYINYSYTPYFENLWVVGLEYLTVFIFLIYELRKYSFSRRCTN